MIAAVGDAIESTAAARERRARARVPLGCAISIRSCQRVGGNLETVTENVNSRGFWCVLAEPLPAGAALACVLRLPLGCGPATTLLCEARVVWVKPLGASRFGVGCRIEDYTVIS